MEPVKIIECPRDAWQGLPVQIPTATKVAYLGELIEAGFRYIDAVSFVSPKHVPQMADSEAVMRGVNALFARSTASPKSESLSSNLQPRIPHPEIIGIVVNEKGLERALATAGVSTIGYPYSISANFRRQNANMSLSESRALVEKLQRQAAAAGRNLVVYISMAFGNPFGEPWGPEIVEEALLWLKSIRVRTVLLADTAGKARPEDVRFLFDGIRALADGIEIGLHLHSRRESAAEKVMAAYDAGCRRFDSALAGLGGCPFAGDEMVGNIPTEVVVEVLAGKGVDTGIEPWALLSALEAAEEIRRNYAEH